MKNKPLLIFGAIAVAVILAGAAVMLTKNSSMTPDNNSTTSTDNEPAANKSLKDLMTSGDSQQCTFTDKIADADASGTFYVSNGKVRGDYTMNAGGQNIVSHMIVTDKTSYTWMDGQTTGYKMAFDPETMSDGSTSTDTQKTVDVNKFIDYKCEGWSEDSSVFDPPSNVKFQEFGAMAPSGAQTTGAQSQCSACDSLSGDDKTQCRTALKCN